MVIVASAVLVGGCADSATPSPSATATARPTPVITPDPHLTDPADLDTIFAELTKAGIAITPINAAAAPEPKRRINATYLDWPLIISEFSSGQALRATTRWKAGAKPIRGNAPYTIIGLNLMFEYGPKVTNAATPGAPEARYREAALQLSLALDPLLGPLEQRSVVALALPTASPTPVPTAAPTSTPAPTPVPS